MLHVVQIQYSDVAAHAYIIRGNGSECACVTGLLHVCVAGMYDVCTLHPSMAFVCVRDYRLGFVVQYSIATFPTLPGSPL